MPVAQFDFPYHVCSDQYPESSTRVRFGQGYEFASLPQGPDQMTYRLQFPAMWFYEASQGVLDITENSTRNAGKLQAFYESVRLYDVFNYPHPSRGMVPVRFKKPLPELVGIPGGNGQVSPFEVELIEQPTLSYGDVPLLREAGEYMETMTSGPSVMMAALVNYTIGRLISAGIWKQANGLFFLCSHHEQASRVNAKDPGSQSTLQIIGVPSFTANLGWVGTNTAASNRLEGLPLIGNSRFARDSNSFYCYVLNNVQSNALGSIGVQDYLYINPRSIADESGWKVGFTTTFAAAPSTDSRGLWLAERLGSSLVRVYRDNIQQGADNTTASAALPASAAFRVLAGNTSQSSPHRIGFAGYGGTLTASQKALLRVIVRDYMIALGATVL